MQRFFPSQKLLLLGNPVRQDIIDTASKREAGFKAFHLDSNKTVVLVIGGSLGAKTINESLIDLIDDLHSMDIQFIWQTGKTFEERALEKCRQLKSVRAQAFIFNMDLAYATADIIISRAGASTISELCLVGKPAILIPSPNVAEDHQTKNAMALVEKSAAIMLSDVKAKKELKKTLIDLINNKNKQIQLAKNISEMAIVNSSKLIVDEVLKLVETNES